MYHSFRHTHKQTLVRIMLEKAITASQVTHISNANQYFVELEHEGLCFSQWGKLGNSKVKFRSIPFNKVNEAKRRYGIAS